MKFWAVFYDAGMCGTDMVEKVEAETSDEAVDTMEATAWEWYYSFPHDDEDDIEPELNIYAVAWDEEAHGGLV